MRESVANRVRIQCRDRQVLLGRAGPSSAVYSASYPLPVALPHRSWAFGAAALFPLVQSAASGRLTAGASIL